MSHVCALCGWYDSAVSGPFTRPRSIHARAFGRIISIRSRGDDSFDEQFLCGTLLAKRGHLHDGAVNEPLSAFTPDISCLSARSQSEAYTFGERVCSADVALMARRRTIRRPALPSRAGQGICRHLHAELEKSPEQNCSNGRSCSC